MRERPVSAQKYARVTSASGMIQGIEGEIHRRSFALQALTVMSQSMRAGIVIANHLGSTCSVLQRAPA